MSEEVVPEASQLRKRRLLIMAAVGGAVFVSLAAWAMLSESSASHHENEPVKLTTAAEVIDEKAVWVNRIESQAKAVQAENQELRQQQQILKKQVDVLEEVFKAQSTLDVQSDVQVQASSQGVAPAQAGVTHTRSVPLQEPQLEDFSQPVDTSPEPHILHLSVNLPHKPKRHLAKYYIPAGSYSRGILTSGVVVSTAQASQANPQPIIIRLISKAMLPRKFRNNIKDAAVVGACYGSLSSERANCRLHKLSLVKRSGVILERDITGWIIGVGIVPQVFTKI